MALIIILLAVAGLLLLKYSEMLGRTTGEERPRDWLRQDDANPANDSDAAAAPPVDHEDISALTDLESDMGQALVASKGFEPRLDMRQVLDGACKAYEMVLLAYENGDKDTLQQLLERDVFESFEAAIDARNEAGYAVEARIVRGAEAQLEDARLIERERRLEIDLRLSTEMITAVYDSEGDLVEGDPNTVQEISGVWTFVRALGSPDPSWMISATE